MTMRNVKGASRSDEPTENCRLTLSMCSNEKADGAAVCHLPSTKQQRWGLNVACGTLSMRQLQNIYRNIYTYSCLICFPGSNEDTRVTYALLRR